MRSPKLWETLMSSLALATLAGCSSSDGTLTSGPGGGSSAETGGAPAGQGGAAVGLGGNPASSATGGNPNTASPTGGVASTQGGSSSTGASATGGALTSNVGGATTGGRASAGGTSAGGTATGGIATGGKAAGGTATGGTGTATGGKAAGGAATGGASVGGTATGGKATGGAATGGAATGGRATGGVTSATGGASSPGTCSTALGNGTCPAKSCPAGATDCGCYNVPDLGVTKKAILDAGGDSRFMASAMVETENLKADYTLGDGKTGDAFNAGRCKQNWYMIRQCHTAWNSLTASNYTTSTAMNSDLALDIQVYNECRAKWSESVWFAGHRNGQTGLQTGQAPNLALFIAASKWTQTNLENGHLCDNVRFWATVPAIVVD